MKWFSVILSVFMMATFTLPAFSWDGNTFFAKHNHRCNGWNGGNNGRWNNGWGNGGGWNNGWSNGNGGWGNSNGGWGNSGWGNGGWNNGNGFGWGRNGSHRSKHHNWY